MHQCQTLSQGRALSLSSRAWSSPWKQPVMEWRAWMLILGLVGFALLQLWSGVDEVNGTPY
jgi:hypothetical protein